MCFFCTHSSVHLVAPSRMNFNLEQLCSTYWMIGLLMDYYWIFLGS